jgi:hypothetical protein
MMKFDEHRQHPRYAVEQNVFLTVRPEFRKIGRVKDIGNGGVCFEYAVFEPDEKLSFCEVDILSEGGKFHLFKVPCRVAYDVQISPEPFQQIQMRRCGLRFEGLSAAQTAQILNTVLMADLVKTNVSCCAKQENSPSAL